jgi:hypothetical protein
VLATPRSHVGVVSDAVRMYVTAAGTVFSFSIDWGRKIFQHVALTILGGQPLDVGLHSLRAASISNHGKMEVINGVDLPAKLHL